MSYNRRSCRRSIRRDQSSNRDLRRPFAASAFHFEQEWDPLLDTMFAAQLDIDVLRSDLDIGLAKEPDGKVKI